MRTYTEQQVRDVWNYTVQHHPDTPSAEFQRSFLRMLTAAVPKEKAMLFTRDELLDAAATEHEKVMIYGICAMIGTEMANEAALMSRAREASLGGNMAIVIGLARARKDENLTPGKVYVDAAGKTLLRIQSGKWMRYTLDTRLHDDDFAVRPLKEI